MARKKKKVRVIRRISTVLLTFACVAFFAGVAILLFTFAPLAKEEVKYALLPMTSKKIIPIDTTFGIVIPRLGANARIVANVDPFDSAAYQQALTRGVAHARGTAFPGTKGDVFLFAHSSEDFYHALQYNSVFYLLNKLKAGDEILLYYQNNTFVYVVTDSIFVNPKDISYLTGDQTKQTLTLMTCWPPGTNIQRLLVFAELKK